MRGALANSVFLDFAIPKDTLLLYIQSHLLFIA